MGPQSVTGIVEFLLFYYGFPVAVVLALIAVILAFERSTRKASWLFSVVCIVFCIGICLIVLHNLSQNHSQDPARVFFGVCGKLCIPLIIAGVVCWFVSRVMKRDKEHDHDA